ncbi:helix-turn-helix domain-containing protein [Deinococcus enclensis]|uniref:Excisionase family DNA binding protein n=1 Tax=Deinococcus enclensis TaxID=1049582 RepID=A0ABT9MDN5_9DEIO|nr:helix-turn-helix domain-containing protein [Deinococcus enclensis]MDP9764731.1 excisionase family DNA binding protein [Deinococcus enclensis]
MDEVMTLEDLAAYLKISETTAYQLVRSGAIPGRKVGREWRFLKRRIENWLMQDSTDDATGENGTVRLDALGGEFRIENGQEQIALWLPMTREEKAAQIEKAQRDGVNVSDVVAAYLREWVRSG